MFFFLTWLQDPLLCSEHPDLLNLHQLPVAFTEWTRCRVVTEIKRALCTFYYITPHTFPREAGDVSSMGNFVFCFTMIILGGAKLAFSRAVGEDPFAFWYVANLAAGRYISYFWIDANSQYIWLLYRRGHGYIYDVSISRSWSLFALFDWLAFVYFWRLAAIVVIMCVNEKQTKFWIWTPVQSKVEFYPSQMTVKARIQLNHWN